MKVGPVAASRTPPTAGPAIAAIWKIVTYKLKALVSCALSTSRGTSAWRAGLSKAVAAPATKARP